MKWRSRIVDHGKADPRSINLNPLNHRGHPQAQRDVLHESLDEFGIFDSVTINRTTGNLINGEARVKEALDEIDRLEAANEDFSHVVLDVEYVEMSLAEEASVLAIFDRITEMAIVDPGKLDLLLSQVNAQSPGINKMLADLKVEVSLHPEPVVLVGTH